MPSYSAKSKPFVPTSESAFRTPPQQKRRASPPCVVRHNKRAWLSLTGPNSTDPRPLHVMRKLEFAPPCELPATTDTAAAMEVTDAPLSPPKPHPSTMADALLSETEARTTTSLERSWSMRGGAMLELPRQTSLFFERCARCAQSPATDSACIKCAVNKKKAASSLQEPSLVQRSTRRMHSFVPVGGLAPRTPSTNTPLVAPRPSSATRRDQRQRRMYNALIGITASPGITCTVCSNAENGVTFDPCSRCVKLNVTEMLKPHPSI